MSWKSIRETWRELDLRSDPEALYAKAQQERIVLGRYSAVKLKVYGIGVPPLWPTHTPKTMVGAPQGITSFRQLSLTPVSCLWAAMSSRTEILASRHVQFVGAIARVLEAVDLVPGGPYGQQYVLSLEPVRVALERCLTTSGFGGDLPEDRLTRLSGWAPYHWSTDRKGRAIARAIPKEDQRRVLIRLACVAGEQPTLTEQTVSNDPECPELAPAPAKDELLDLLEGFFLRTHEDS